MKILVMHASYGCDTGCCGHVIEVDGEEVEESFDFDHPGCVAPSDDERDAEHRAFAEDFVRRQMGDEHVADLDWPNSIIIDD